MAEPTTQAYVERWFLPFADLVARTGGNDATIAALIDAGAAPGPVYVRDGDRWWNALEGSAAPDGERWYAPAAAYWLRRALLAMRDGASAAEAARMNHDHFVSGFVTALENEPLALVPFGDAMVDGSINPVAARQRASAEWADWINGGYAVCLRSFTGQTCVEKEALGHYLRRADPDGANDLVLLDLVERLSALMLPFAPFQRPGGTPGFAVDRLLAVLQLGDDDPYRGLA